MKKLSSFHQDKKQNAISTRKNANGTVTVITKNGFVTATSLRIAKVASKRAEIYANNISNIYLSEVKDSLATATTEKRLSTLEDKYKELLLSTNFK